MNYIVEVRDTREELSSHMRYTEAERAFDRMMDSGLYGEEELAIWNVLADEEEPAF